MEQEPHLLVVGSANVDLVTRVVEAPVPGQTVMGKSFATITGGKGANQAVGAARLGVPVHFAGCVGDDEFGAMLRNALAADGINLDLLRTDPKAATGTAVILVADSGQNSIVVTPGANASLRPEHVPDLGPVLDVCDAMLVQLETPLDTVAAALDLAREKGVLSILDIGSDQPVSDELLAKADIVSPNESEAEAITGIKVDSVDSARDAAVWLLDHGARSVVLKLGAMGCIFMDREEAMHVPAFPITPVDTTAAGDAFTAALGVSWGHVPPAAALNVANATGALAATKAGAQPSMPTMDEVSAFLDANQ